MCVICGWGPLLEKIDELLGDARYEFADNTLEGIAKWVEEQGHCTAKQRGAVENIAAAGLRRKRMGDWDEDY